MPPRTLVHPPWRQIAESFLKHKAPELYRALKEAGELDAHLEQKADHAWTTYEHLVRKLEEKHPPDRVGALLYSVQEIVQRDILDPTT